MRWNRLPVLGVAALLAVFLACAGGSRPGAMPSDEPSAGAPGEAAEAPTAEEPAGTEGAADRDPAAAADATASGLPQDDAGPDSGPAGAPEPVPAPAEVETRDAQRPAVEGPSAPAETPAAPAPRKPDGAAPAAPAARTPSEAPAPVEEKKPPAAEPPRTRAVVALLPEHLTFPHDGPSWAREKEELVYKVGFLGLTMGYARLTFRGKVLLEGREAYHLTVRAWTSDLLSLVYPMNDTIEYYLDVTTFAPIRVEFTRAQKEDDIAFYDQETGSIVYRYKSNGNVRKTVDAVPGVYDPVSVAYFFRTRDLAGSEESRPMYGGKNLYEISARPLGYERIRTERGEFDTVLIQPVLRRGGAIDKKGDLRLWMTRDDRHLPVRLYAKFRKIRTWTLVGELLPAPQEG